LQLLRASKRDSYLACILSGRRALTSLYGLKALHANALGLRANSYEYRRWVDLYQFDFLSRHIFFRTTNSPTTL